MTNLKSCVAKRLIRYQPYHPNFGTKEVCANIYLLCSIQKHLIALITKMTYLGFGIIFYEGDAALTSAKKSNKETLK